MKEKHSQHIKQMKFDEVESILERGDSNQLRTLLETGQFNDINKPKSLHGPTLLMIACKTGSIDCVKILLEYKADIRYRNYFDSVLSSACSSGNVNVVRFVIASGFEINDEIINNVFRSKILMKNTPIISVLIEYICDINNKFKETFISLASRADNADVVRLLLERGANPNIMYNNCIITACTEGHLEVLKVLLTWNAVDELIQQDMSKKALEYALHSGHVHIVRYLVEYGVEYDTQEALKCSVICNHVQVTEYLIDNGVEFLTTTIVGGYSLLTHACCGDHPDMVKLLLSR